MLASRPSILFRSPLYLPASSQTHRELSCTPPTSHSRPSVSKSMELHEWLPSNQRLLSLLASRHRHRFHMVGCQRLGCQTTWQVLSPPPPFFFPPCAFFTLSLHLFQMVVHLQCRKKGHWRCFSDRPIIVFSSKATERRVRCHCRDEV